MAELAFNHVTVKHYAEMVGKSIRTIYRWIAERKIKARKDRGGRGWLILVEGSTTFYKKEKSIP